MTSRKQYLGMIIGVCTQEMNKINTRTWHVLCFLHMKKNKEYIIVGIDFSIKKFTPPEDGIRSQRRRKKSITIPIMHCIQIETVTMV
jgi:hypothetical protein